MEDVHILAVDPGMCSGYAILKTDTSATKFDVLASGIVMPPEKLDGRDFRLAHQREAIHKTVQEVGIKDWYVAVESQWLAMEGGKTVGNPYAILAVGEISGYWLMAGLHFTAGNRVQRVAPSSWQSYFERSRRDTKKWSVEKVAFLHKTQTLKGAEVLKPYADNKADAILIGIYAAWSTMLGGPTDGTPK